MPKLSTSWQARPSPPSDLCVCVCVCVYVQIHTHTHTHKSPPSNLKSCFTYALLMLYSCFTHALLLLCRRGGHRLPRSWNRNASGIYTYVLHTNIYIHIHSYIHINIHISIHIYTWPPSKLNSKCCRHAALKLNVSDSYMMLFWGGEYLIFWKNQGIIVYSGSTSLKGEQCNILLCKKRKKEKARILQEKNEKALIIQYYNDVTITQYYNNVLLKKEKKRKNLTWRWAVPSTLEGANK